MKSQLKATLLIDNSNSRTKLMLANGTELSGGKQVIPTADLSVVRLKEACSGWVFHRVVVASVVPSCREVFNAAFACDIHYINAQSPMLLSFDYDGLNTLGADRIANAVGAASLGLYPCIAIDAGTAVTFDLVLSRDGSPVYLGGVISPGLKSFMNYMATCTAQLPHIEFPGEDIPIVGKNTKTAMSSGALYGFLGMVREIVTRIQNEIGESVHIILTGGDADLLYRELYPDASKVNELTFMGLLHVANRL